MRDFFLIQRLRELRDSKATLLWLEGSTYERVVSAKLQAGRLVLVLANETSRVVAYDRYAVTDVGLQFWSQGRPGVLYRWDQVPRELWQATLEQPAVTPEEPPPHAAA